MKIFGLFIGFALFLNDGIAQKAPIIAPQPTTCISSSFSSSGSAWWQTVLLKITNNCNQPVNFQNSTITFSNNSNLNATFWGNFAPLSYPINNLQITSQPQGNTYLSSLSLQFPTDTGSNSILPAGASFTIIYGAPKADYIANTVNVYLNTTISTGTLSLNNVTTQPPNVTQTYGLVKLTLNNQLVSTVAVPWSGTQTITGLASGTYSLFPVNVNSSNGVTYQGQANPATVTLQAGSTSSSTISYQAIQTAGNINVNLSALPLQLAGYTSNPVLSLNRIDNNTSTTATLNWGSANLVSNLVNGITYTFSTPSISYNGYNCTPSFTPSSAIAATTAPTVQLTYACKQAAQTQITVNVTGAPSNLTSSMITFTPTGGASPVSGSVALNNGVGSAAFNLNTGSVYTVNATPANGYSVNYSPQPFTANAGATETITYVPNSTSNGGRIIGYLPGWITPPPASAVAKAGYTHILVAFGVFSTTTPGQITSAFSTITPSYIQSLHNLGIKVSLSIGGASSSIPNTTVNFHQVLSAASSPAAFVQTFLSSLQSLMTQYGFDGFDFDIESGLNSGGTFTNPSGDIAVLAQIINNLHSSNPNALISLAPQIANIAATSGFSEPWGNYASLVMQTHQSLSWVGIQMYNSGCAYGINLICYDPNNSRSPDTSVAMATDLLENWPATTSSGQRTGFQPYISYLTPSQVVLGYPAPNASGQSDGSPAAVISTIKRAIQCLRTNVVSSSSCDTYKPPRAYPGFGGVFDWEVIHDANNNYGFSTGLYNCVINGNCS